MGGLKVAKCGKRTFSFSSSTEYTVTTLQHAELGCGVRGAWVPKLVGFMMGLGYNSRVHETGNIRRVAGGQRVGCHSVVKKPRGFLKHINLGLRGAGNSDGRKDLGKRLGDHQAELALLQASKPRPNELREGENRGGDARSRVGGGPMGDRGPITRTWSDFFLRCACTGPPSGWKG